MAIILTPLQAGQSAALSLGKDQELRQYGMTAIELLQEGQRFSLKLAESLSELYVAYNPTAFQEEDGKKPLTLSVAATSELSGALLCFESRVKDLLRAKYPKVDALWNSCVKEPTEKAPLMVRSKLFPQSARLFDENKKETTFDAVPLTTWRGLPTNVVLQVKGVYARKDSLGLQLTATHVQLGSERVAPAMLGPVIENPF